MIRNLSPMNKEGFTLIEVIVTFVVAAILATLFVNYMGGNLIGGSTSAVRAQDHYELIAVGEKMNIDYNKLMNAGDTNVLGTLQSRIAAGNYGQYTQVTKFITFDSGTERIAATPGSNTLKATISRGDQTITIIFTK
jgi:prepilin-type N-terminal cleavage/methylation domain-containing protein